MRMSFSMLGRLISVRLRIIDLLIDVGLHRDPLHQRLQHRLRVDIDARRRLVHVGQAEHDDDADDADDPGDGKADPATMPHPLQDGRLPVGSGHP